MIMGLHLPGAGGGHGTGQGAAAQDGALQEALALVHQTRACLGLEAHSIERADASAMALHRAHLAHGADVPDLHLVIGGADGQVVDRVRREEAPLASLRRREALPVRERTGGWLRGWLHGCSRGWSCGMRGTVRRDGLCFHLPEVVPCAPYVRHSCLCPGLCRSIAGCTCQPRPLVGRKPQCSGRFSGLSVLLCGTHHVVATGRSFPPLPAHGSRLSFPRPRPWSVPLVATGTCNIGGWPLLGCLNIKWLVLAAGTGESDID